MESSTAVIVDDDADIRILLRLLLETSGYRIVAEASDGAAAIAAVSQLSPPPIPDVVVLDNAMPHMTGLEAARRLRAEHPALAIVLCSAYLDDGMRAEARAAGITACLSKQSYEQLPQLIARVVGTTGS